MVKRSERAADRFSCNMLLRCSHFEKNSGSEDGRWRTDSIRERVVLVAGAHASNPSCERVMTCMFSLGTKSLLLINFHIYSLSVYISTQPPTMVYLVTHNIVINNIKPSINSFVSFNLIIVNYYLFFNILVGRK